MKEKEPILEVRGLKMYFPIKKGIIKRTAGYVKAVNDVSFTINKGETFGLVGESGCGKSTTGRCICRLLKPTKGSIIYKNDVDMAGLEGRSLKSQRRHIQMIFQNPYASLNPRKTIMDIIKEPVLINLDLTGKQAEERVYELLEQVGLQKDYAKRYAHEFSGGQRQRIAIARALSINPDIIIADEAVSALDVSIQSQILNLFNDLKKKISLTYLFVSHNLSVVKHMSDTIGVMYLGEMVEVTDKEELFDHPLHPYTEVLLSAVPDVAVDEERPERIILKGEVPSPGNPPDGCYFHQRCPKAMDMCSTHKPVYKEVRPNHFVACNLYNQA